MSPSKTTTTTSQQYRQPPSSSTKRPSEINGARPSPLMINRDSHLIHKPSGAANAGGATDPNHRRKPVIIYTHSPKVIHTQARDFMALVQKLTGMTRSSASVQSNKEEIEVSAASDVTENDASSVLTDDICGGGAAASATPITRYVNSIFGEFPPFTPNSAADFFCSPRPVHRFSDSGSNGMYGSPNSLSPSVVEFMKGFSEY